jgi:broad specificity phosphatase PhoE
LGRQDLPVRVDQGTFTRVTATFLLVRHAAHVDLDLRLSGRRDGVALSDAGRAQAERLGAALADEAIARIVCSPLDRTVATAAAIAAAQPGLSVEPDAALIEIDLGDWTGRALDSFGDDPAWTAWNAQRGSARIPGGESMAEAQRRIVGCLDMLAAAHDAETIAVVTHSDMIRAAVAHVLAMSLDDLLRFDIAPASVTRMVWGDWGARLISLNEKVA